MFSNFVRVNPYKLKYGKKHIKWSLNELQAGDPFKTITEKKIKYSFYCK